MKAMILAAGIGSRMLPLTLTKPKALIEIQGVSLLEHTIRYLKFYGVDEIIINIHHHAVQIIDFIKDNHSFGINIKFSDETDKLLDTGGGLYKAKWFFTDDKPFILTSSDVITDLDLNDMMAAHVLSNSLVSLAVKKRKSTRDFLFDEQFLLCGWQNNITGEQRIIRQVNNPVSLAFSTIHMINPAIFELITERGVFSIIDVYLRLTRSQSISGFRHDQSNWLECGRFSALEFLENAPEIKALYEKYHK
jgi:NDP-sugar pyrophosphorylase family protein